MCPHTFVHIEYLKAFLSPSFTPTLSLFSLRWSSSLIHTVHEACISWGHTGCISGSVVLWQWAEWLPQTLHHIQQHTSTHTNLQTETCTCVDAQAHWKTHLDVMRVNFFVGRCPQLYMQASAPERVKGSKPYSLTKQQQQQQKICKFISSNIL